MNPQTEHSIREALLEVKLTLRAARSLLSATQKLVEYHTPRNFKGHKP